MQRSLFRSFCLLPVLQAAALFAQTPAPATPLAFEVASIKSATLPTPAQMMSGQVHIGMKIDAARVDIGSLSLADLIRIAYRVKSYQLTGPAWINTERFDILAKLPDGANKDQVPEMIQALLAERFKLTVHRETKDHQVYALIVGKGGPKLKDAEPDEPPPAPDAAGSRGGMTINTGEGQLRISGRPDSGRGMVIGGGPNGNTRVSMGANGAIHMESSKVTMVAFAEMISRFVDRPVVDMTDLKGNYQVALDLSMEDMRNVASKAGMAMPAPGGGDAPRQQPAEAASDPSGSSIFAAVQQLGLKLDARKAPLELIVVDRLEKAPTEN